MKKSIVSYLLVFIFLITFCASCSRSLTDIGYKTTDGAMRSEAALSASSMSSYVGLAPSNPYLGIVTSPTTFYPGREVDYGHYSYITDNDIKAFSYAKTKTRLRLLRDFYKQISSRLEGEASLWSVYKPLIGNEIYNAIENGSATTQNPVRGWALFLPNGTRDTLKDLRITSLGSDRFSVKEEGGADSVVVNVKFAGKNFQPVITALLNPSLNLNISATDAGMKGKGFKYTDAYDNPLSEEYTRKLANIIYNNANKSGLLHSGLIGDKEILAYGASFNTQKRQFANEFYRSLNAENVSVAQLDKSYQGRCSADMAKAMKDYKRREANLGKSNALGGWAMFVNPAEADASNSAPTISETGNGWLRVGNSDDEANAAYILIANTLDKDAPVIIGLVNKKQEAVIAPVRK